MSDELVVYELVQHVIVLFQEHQLQNEMTQLAYFYYVHRIDNSRIGGGKKAKNTQ
jgi:hypothetical protein